MPIFKIKKDKTNNWFYPEYVREKYIVPNKIYGDLYKNAVMVWNTYIRDGKSTGVLLTGYKGAGKSLLTNLISNIAIDNNVNVYVIEDLDGTIELVSFINSLRNCVIILDEFGKMFNMGLQNKMLNMFSDNFGSNKLFIVAENSMRNVSEFILNRPGRLLFGLDFSKLDIKVFEEYVADFPIDIKFLEDLRTFYKKSVEFTFDHISSIIKMHLQYPEKSMEELVKILNIKTTSNDSYKYIGYKVLKDGEFYKYITDATLYMDDLQYGRYWYYRTNDGTNITLTKEDITSVEDDIATFESAGYKFLFVNSQSPMIKKIFREANEYNKNNPSKNTNEFQRNILEDL